MVEIGSLIKNIGDYWKRPENLGARGLDLWALVKSPRHRNEEYD